MLPDMSTSAEQPEQGKNPDTSRAEAPFSEATIAAMNRVVDGMRVEAGTSGE